MVSAIKKRRHTTCDESTRRDSVEPRRLSLNIKPSKKAAYKSFLNKILKSLKSVKQVVNDLNYDENIENDANIYKQIPYVVIMKDYQEKQSPLVAPVEKVHKSSKSSKAKVLNIRLKSQGENKVAPLRIRLPIPIKDSDDDSNSVNEGSSLSNRRSDRLSKPIEVIELSSGSDGEGDDRTRRAERRKTGKSKKLPPSERPGPKSRKARNRNRKQNTDKFQKIPIKIRLSAKFVVPAEAVEEETKSKKKNKNKKHYLCNVCDKRFNANCTFKIHELWHEKPEAVIINLDRRELPTSIKASVYDPNKPMKKKNKSTTDKDVNDIVNKYVDGLDSESDKSKEVEEKKEKSKDDSSDEEKSNLDSKEENEETDKETSNNQKKDDEEKEEGETNDSKEVVNGREEDDEDKENDDSRKTKNVNGKSVAEDDKEDELSNHTEKNSDKDSDSQEQDNDEQSKSMEKGNNEVDLNCAEDETLKKRKKSGNRTELTENDDTNLHGATEAADENNEQSSLKRKRNNLDVSNVEENSNNTEKVTPKTKRVRFATDLETSSDEVLNLNNGTEEKNLSKPLCSI